MRERVAPDKLKSQFFLSFWRSNLISCERVAPDKLKSQFFLSFWAIEPHFVRKGCAGQVGNRNFSSVFGDRTSFRAKGLRPDKLKIANFTSVFDDRTSFRAKGLRRTSRNRNFTPVFCRSNLISCERVAPDKSKSQFYPSFLTDRNLIFVRKGCVFVPSRCHCPCSRLQRKK